MDPPSLLRPQADSRDTQYSTRCGLGLGGARLPGPLLSRRVYHAQDTGLHIEALDDFGVGILEGDDGDLTHLAGTAADLDEIQEMRRALGVPPRGHWTQWGNRLSLGNQLPWGKTCSQSLAPFATGSLGYSAF